MEMSVDVMLKKVGKKMCYALVGVILLLSIKMPIWADETESQNIMTLQQLTENAELKAEPNVDAETVLNLPMGTGVIAHGESQDSWTYVEYAGAMGYIESNLLVPYGTLGTGDGSSLMQELQQEMETIEIESFRTIEEYELERKERRKAMIWGIIIAALVAGIFALGVMSAISNDMEEKEKFKRRNKVKRADHDEEYFEDEDYEEIDI